MRAGPCNKWVTLSQSPLASGGEFTPLDPEGVWAAIEPLPAGGTDNRALAHVVRMRFHPGVTFDTKVEYVDARTSRTRALFVRGFQSVNEAGDELQLYCEEVQ